MAFNADFTIDNDGIHANEKIYFKNSSTSGFLIDSDFLEIDGDVAKGDLDLSNYIVSSISKLQWSFTDGNFFNTDDVIHRFKESKTERVTLKIWSEAFVYQGNTFYFTHNITKDVDIQSRFYKFIKDHYPIYDEVRSNELDDLMKSAGKFFDRMHTDIGGLTSLIDIHRIDPEYLEYWALTLGHTEYAKKVGYQLETNDFDNYDIFDKIKYNTATSKEIDTLRNFLLFSADLFRNKGTPDNIVKFLKFFDVDAKIKDLWTQSWTVILRPSIIETFSGYTDFDDNQLKLKWDNIKVADFNNSQSHFVKNFSSIVLDSYHIVEEIENPYDEVATVAISGDKFGWKEFELTTNYGLTASPSIISHIYKIDGSPVIDSENDDFTLYTDVVPNSPTRFNPNKFSVLQIDPTAIADGDRLSILYDLPYEGKKDCIVTTTTEKVKDFDLKVSFKPKQENTRTNLYRAPDNEIFVSFRGIKSSIDNNSDYNDFYKFSVNTDRSTFSLSKIILSDSINDYLTQHISLSYNNDEVYEPIIIYPETSSISASEVFVFDREKEYELLLMVNGSSLSSYVREKRNENVVKADISNFEGNNNIYGVTEIEWTPLIENFSFDVLPKKVKTVDAYGNEMYAETYTVINEAGYYGFGVKDGIVEYTRIELNNLDPDTRLYNEVEKELELKPKHLERIPSYETRMDNYENTKKDFLKVVSEDFKTNTTYDVSKEESNSLDILFVDKASVPQTLGTRLTVNFNQDWINSNFSSDEDLINKIIIPIGSQRNWFMPEQRVLSSSNYDSYNTTSGAPGFFSADFSPMLGEYSLEPLDSFSSVSRANIDTYTLNFNNRLQQYIDYRADGFTLDGVWEEVYPYSNVFESISKDIVLDDSSVYVNKMFVPITVDIADGTRVLGVKFKNCDNIKSLINRYGTEFNKEVQLWGSFTLHVPCNTTLYKPSSYPLEESNKFPGHYMMTIFVPMGILNEAVLNYSLGREFTQQSDNYPSLIDLNGIFAKLVPEKLTVSSSSATVITPNPYESAEKGLMVRYFVSGKMDLLTKITKPVSFSSEKRNYVFTLDQQPREFLESLSSSESDFNWWVPTEVWRRRDFEIQQVDLEEDIASGINFADKSMDENNNPKLFFGKEIPTNNQNIKSLSIKLTDGVITPSTIYYARVKINITYSGVSSQNLDSLTESEKNNVKINGQKYTDDLKLAAVKVCKEMIVPIAWYGQDELTISNPNYDKCSTNPAVSATFILSDTLEYANFIERSFKGNETITFAPMGLMTDAINQKPVSNINILLNNEDLAKFVSESEWNHNSWNKFFIEHLEISEIIEEVQPENFKLFDKYIILAQSKINIGANLEFSYNSSELGWDVLKNFSYFINNHVNEDLIFDIPYDLIDINDWNADIKDVFLNRYIIDKSLYTIGEGKITIGTSDLLENLVGGVLTARYNFDFYFDKERKYETVEDDFNTTRQIKWIPYESNSTEIYENMKRIPSNNLLLGLPVDNSTNSHDIIIKDNIYAFRSLNKNSLYPFEGRQSGTRTNNRSVSITQNEPNARRIFMIDNDNFIFDIQADVYFDSKLNEIKNYRGKKFEMILKAGETFDTDLGKNILSNYYFAGIGTYDFDAAIGVSQYNKDTKKNESSFLAGFGDYNTKNIKSNVWYRLRCIVTNDYIRVLFNEKDEPERLVMNYFINEKYQTDTSRYLSGDFEELVYNVAGLDKLNITYPEKAGENTNDKFVRRYIDNELIPAVRPTGSLCGFRIYNEYTYMTNIHYKYLSEDGYQVGNAFDVSNLSDLISDINKKY